MSWIGRLFSAPFRTIVATVVRPADLSPAARAIIAAIPSGEAILVGHRDGIERAHGFRLEMPAAGPAGPASRVTVAVTVIHRRYCRCRPYTGTEWTEPSITVDYRPSALGPVDSAAILAASAAESDRLAAIAAAARDRREAEARAAAAAALARIRTGGRQ